MKRVVIESPYKGNVARNKLYLQFCIRDCIRRGESPYASHQMLTEALNDDDPEERRQGIEAGYAWYPPTSDLVAFYLDLGNSTVMGMARDVCLTNDVRHEDRNLPEEAMREFIKECVKRGLVP